METFKFDNIDQLQRRRDIECNGVRLGLPGDIELIVRAASDANPLWKAQSERINAQLRAFVTARAGEGEIRAYLARKFAELLVKDWPKAPKANGEPVPFSVDACEAFLLQADDAFAALDGMVWETKNFRTTMVTAVIEHLGN